MRVMGNLGPYVFPLHLKRSALLRSCELYGGPRVLPGSGGLVIGNAYAQLEMETGIGSLWGNNGYSLFSEMGGICLCVLHNCTTN